MTPEEINNYINKKSKFYTFIWLFFLFELIAFFSLFFYYLVEVPKETLKSGNDFNTVFLYLSYIIVIAVVPLSYKIYDIKRKQAVKKTGIQQKAEIYFMTVLINFSLFEFAAILTLAAFYINKMYEPLYMFGIIFVAVLLNKPSLKRFLQIKDEKTENHVIISEKEKDKPKFTDNEQLEK